MKFPTQIRPLSNEQPHESWGGWKNFLSSCEIRDQYRGITFFGSVNCNYILFPDGLLIQNYGYHGNGLMQRLRKEGVKKVKQDLFSVRKEIEKILSKLRT